MTRSLTDKLFELDPEIERIFRALRIQEKISEESESALLSSDNSMADHNRTMKELVTPDEAFKYSCIPYPTLAGDFELRSRLIHLLPKYQGLSGEDPNRHLHEFHVVCSTMKPQGISEEDIKLRAFPFSLTGVAKDWLYYLSPGFITSWIGMKKAFLEKLFSASRTATIRKSICGIQQVVGETLYDYWERFKKLCSSCPQHQISDLVQYFYEGLLPMDRSMIDVAARRALVNKTPEQARELISNMAENSQQFGSRALTTRGVGEVQMDSNEQKQIRNSLMELTSLAKQLSLNNATQSSMCFQQGQNFGQQALLAPSRLSLTQGNSSNASNSDAQQARLEELMQQIFQQQQNQQRTDSALQNIERQIRQLASSINQIQAQGSSQLTSQTTPNPKGNVSALTLRSGRRISESASEGRVADEDPANLKFCPADPQLISSRNEIPEVRNVPTSSSVPIHIDPLNLEHSQGDGSLIPKNSSSFCPAAQFATENPDFNKSGISGYQKSAQKDTKPNITLPFPQRKTQLRRDVEEERAKEFQELVNLFSKVEVNVPLLTMIKQIPKYAKFLKDLCVHKKKLKGNELISMGKNVSALFQPVPQKCEDSGVFTVPCEIGSSLVKDAMLDLGTSINMMPKSVFQTLGIGPLQPTGVVIQLADRSQTHPAGVIEDVLVKVRELIFPVDFYILDMEGDYMTSRSPLILGRPFLKTARTKIDVHVGTLSMEIGDTVVQFSIFDAMKHPREDYSILSLDISEELDSMEFFSEFDSDSDLAEVEKDDVPFTALEDVLDLVMDDVS
ncbi:uncharacterized protein LOC122042261 [Zingiber officinale]|uniref:uncharacterized protein LOC122042261 n=1 Tax=Zingiber officinale TaxID=94328 RepID=UPI001C4C2329|nr:uncharacterized protein LOC122042261 [Zingiber officinale]